MKSWTGRIGIAAAILAGLLASEALAAPSLLSHGQTLSLQTWLNQHRSFRVATERDCNCDDDIRQARTEGPWEAPIPNYEPYLMVGDFRHNGQSDVAAVVTRIVSNKPPEAYLIIFDGPFDKPPKKPAFFGDIEFELRGAGLFTSKQGRNLGFGAFESEGCIFTSRRHTYVEDCANY